MTPAPAGLPPSLADIPGGWAVRDVPVALPGGGERAFCLHLPADPDAVLDEPGVLDRCEADGSDPYWCTLWPVAVTLSETLLRDPPPVPPSGEPVRVLELGCGSALAGLALASAGCDVTATDNQPRAVALAAANAALNGLPMGAELLDWRRPPDGDWPLVVGADLLYQRELHAPLLDCLGRVLAEGGEAVLSDAGRSPCSDFLNRAADAGWRVRMEDPDGRDLLRPRVPGHQILRLTRR